METAVLPPQHANPIQAAGAQTRNAAAAMAAMRKMPAARRKTLCDITNLRRPLAAAAAAAESRIMTVLFTGITTFGDDFGSIGMSCEFGFLQLLLGTVIGIMPCVLAFETHHMTKVSLMGGVLGFLF